jgi:predicted phosphodiesterase
MKRRALVWVRVLSILAGALVAAAPVHVAAAPAAPLVKGPYLQALTATSVEVRWQGREEAPGRVEYGTARDRLDQSAAATATSLSSALEPPVGGAGVGAQRAGPRNLPAGVWLQRAELPNLRPETAYFYRVRQGDATTETFSFRTLAAGPRAVRFIVYGDTRTDTDAHRLVVAAMAKADPKPAFVVHTGDLVTAGDDWPQWDAEFFDPLRTFAASTPIWPVRGNHEQSGAFLRPLFHLPGPAGEFYYRFDVGAARFIVLDAYTRRPPMFAWFEEQLRALPRPAWTFVFVHEPSFSSASKRAYGPGFERERMALLCQRYGVDVVFAGHDHNYMRTVPILAYRTLPGQPTTHVVTGGGGVALTGLGHGSYQAAIAGAHHFCIVDLDGRTFEMAVVSAQNGAVIDRLSLEKDAGGRVMAPADYRAQAREVSDINALESLRRALTAFTAPAVRAGETVDLTSSVDNPFAGPVRATVTLTDPRRHWQAPPPVVLVLPAGAVGVPFAVTLKALRAMEDQYNAGRLDVAYRLPDGRSGTLVGEQIYVAKRSGPAPQAEPDQEAVLTQSE